MTGPDKAGEQGSWASIILIYAIGVLGATTISQAIPVVGDIARIYRAGREVGWIISIPSALVAIGALLTGWIVDRIGDKRVLVAGCAIVIGGDVGVGLAGSIQSLLAMRVVEGVGYLCIAVAAITMMTRITHGARRNIALTLWSSFIPMSFAIPLLLAYRLAGTGQWRWAFYGHAIALGACFALALVQLPGVGTDRVGSRSAGLAAVIRRPGPYLLGLAFASAAFVQTGIVSTLPHLLSGRYGVGIGAASAVGTLGMVLNAAGCLIVGPLLNRRAPPLAIATVGVMCTVSGGLAIGVTFARFYSAVLVSCLFFFGAGLIVGLWALLPRVAPNRQSLGATSGLVTQITLWGVLFGPPMAFAAQANGQWTQESANIIIAGFAILICIWLVVSRYGSGTASDGPVGGQVQSSH